MPLYERLGGIDPATNGPKISVHTFMSVMQEYMLGNMTGAQATTALALTPGEAAEALVLRDRILTEASTSGGIARRAKAAEFENVLILLEVGAVPFHTVAAVKTRLGV